MHGMAPIASELIRDRMERVSGERPEPPAPRRRTALSPVRTAAARTLHSLAERVEPAPRCDPARV
ncbi:MAG: hypothetical protein JWN32_2676 [Solirubrobacterales bacterium]|nr:hypothetical protein [Solirubrobacterales bacterium]